MSSDHLHIYMGEGDNPANNYGWGRVYREYPRIYSFTKKFDNNEYYYLIDEEKEPTHKYTRIFRYGG